MIGYNKENIKLFLNDSADRKELMVKAIISKQTLNISNTKKIDADIHSWILFIKFENES